MEDPSFQNKDLLIVNSFNSSTPVFADCSSLQEKLMVAQLMVMKLLMLMLILMLILMLMLLKTVEDCCKYLKMVKMAENC